MNHDSPNGPQQFTSIFLGTGGMVRESRRHVAEAREISQYSNKLPVSGDLLFLSWPQDDESQPAQLRCPPGRLSRILSRDISSTISGPSVDILIMVLSLDRSSAPRTGNPYEYG
jgi:hypothetical protein